MEKQMEAHLHEESKIWSFLVLCQSQSRMQGGKKRNLTWTIQEDSNCWTHFKYFLDFNSCILYVISNLRKSWVQLFKRCTNWSWNEEVMVVWRQPHQVVRKFRSYEISCEIHLCNLRYLPQTKLDFFLKIFCVNFYFLLVIS